MKLTTETHIQKAGLTPRTANALINNLWQEGEVVTIGRILIMGEDELRSLGGLGEKGVAEILKLQQHMTPVRAEEARIIQKIKQYAGDVIVAGDEPTLHGFVDWLKQSKEV